MFRRRERHLVGTLGKDPEGKGGAGNAADQSSQQGFEDQQQSEFLSPPPR